MTTAQLGNWLKAFWAANYMWFVMALIIIVVVAVMNSLSSKKKISIGQAFILPLAAGTIYFLGDALKVSRWEWFFSLPVVLFGLWRLYVAAQAKNWNGKKELVSGKEISKAAVHFPGLIDCIIFHTLVIGFIWSQNLWVGVAMLVEILFGDYIGGLYLPKLRERWVLFFFGKPRYALSGLDLIQDEQERIYETRIRQRYNLAPSRLWRFLLNNLMWMDNGVNHIRMRSWFPGVSIGIVPCEVQELNGPNEKGYKTDWIPSGPNLFENNDDGKPDTIDIRKGSPTNGPPLMFTYKLTVALYDPRPYFQYSDADRGDRVQFAGVMVRQAEGQLSHMVSILSFDEAQARNSYGLSIDDLNDKRRAYVESTVTKALRERIGAEPDLVKKQELQRKLQVDVDDLVADILTSLTLVNEGMTYQSLFHSIQGELQIHTGARLQTYQLIDVTPDPEVEKAQKARQAAKIAAETAEQEAKALRIRQLAQGQALSLEAGAVATDIYSGDDPVEKALAKREALKIVIARRLSENAGTIPFPTNIFREIFGSNEKIPQ